MYSEIDSWLINPQTVLDNRARDGDDGANSSFVPPSYIQQTTDESFLNTSGIGALYDFDGYGKQGTTTVEKPTQEVDEFALDYGDIDNLLTQELKELDIPLAPEQDQGGDAEFDWRQNILASPNQFQSQHSKKPSLAQARLHKRGPSGTAIFGFANHNKTLSISSIQRTIQDMSKDPNITSILGSNNNNNMPSASPSSIEAAPQYANSTTKSGNATNDELSRLILSQQETLRKELEKQREVNRQLEHQLRENQLQQEKLQQVLSNQEATTQKYVTASSSSASSSPIRRPPQPMANPSPLSMQTPARPQGSHGSRTDEDEKLIITSNSATGTYQFPPPAQLSPSASPTNMGSPSRGFHNRVRNLPIPNLQLGGGDNDYTSAPQPPPAPVFQSSPYRSPSRSPERERVAQQPYTPPPQVSRAPHTKRESVLSTASTIPQPEESESRSRSTGPGGLFGLGLDIGNQPVGSQPLTTIPGSVDNTPVKCPRLPHKATFQHTPVKQTHDMMQMKMQTPTNAMTGTTTTPLRVERDAEGRIHLPNPMEYTPSPTKITKKPTTLPPGSIDHYVKELPDKLFKCVFPGCGKAFKRRYNVRSHIQTHLQDRPYACQHPGCGKSFVRNHDLMRHQKTHGGKTWSCLCGKRFIKESSLEKHQAKMGCAAAHTSPVKENINRDKRGYVLARMDEDLASGTYQRMDPPMNNNDTNRSMILTPSPATFSDLDSM